MINLKINRRGFPNEPPYKGCPYLRFGAPNGPGLDGAGLVEPGEYLGDTAVGDQELARDVAGPDSHESQLHNSSPHVVRQGAPIDKHPAQLVDSGLTFNLIFLENRKKCHRIKLRLK